MSLTKEWFKHNRHPFLGGKHSSLVKRKLSNYARQRLGRKNGNWKGGKKVDKDGYIEIYQPTHPFARNGRYVLEHRLVMEKKIGRFLGKKEVVHHINGIKSDNRIENLFLAQNQSIHNHHHFHRRNKNGQFA